MFGTILRLFPLELFRFGLSGIVISLPSFLHYPTIRSRLKKGPGREGFSVHVPQAPHAFSSRKGMLFLTILSFLAVSPVSPPVDRTLKDFQRYGLCDKVVHTAKMGVQSILRRVKTGQRNDVRGIRAFVGALQASDGSCCFRAVHYWH